MLPVLASSLSFDPSQLADLALYLRADADVLSDTALQLVSGSSQYLDLASGDSDFNMGSGDFTIAGWVYVDSLAATQYIVTKYHSASGFKGFRLYINTTGNIYFELTDAGGITTNLAQSSDKATVGKWFFITARYDGSNMSIRHYDIAGFLRDKSLAHSTGMNPTTKPFLVGSVSNAPSNTFDGRIDSLAIYKGKALSNAECDTLWNSGTGTTYSDLSAAQKTSILAWWPMNEASGTRKDAHTGGYDLSENPGTILSSVGLATGTAGDKDSISLWSDQSPTTNNASQGSASLRPTLQLNLANGKPGLAFDGSDDVLSTSLFLDLNGDLLIAWVENYTSGVSTLFFESLSPVSFIRHDSATSLTVGDVFSATSQVNHANIATPDVSHISMLDRKSGVLTYYLDGTPYSLGSFPEAWSFDRIGKIQGDLLELIAVDSSPSTVDRNQLGAYLAAKYGLTWS